MSSLLAYRMLLRLRWAPLALVIVSTLLALMVAGVLASVQNISSYSTEEAVKLVPVHYVVSISLTPVGGDRSALPELHRDMVDVGVKLKRGVAGSVITLAEIALANLTTTTPTPVGSSPAPSLPVPVLPFLDKPAIGSFYGGVPGLRVTAGSMGSDSVGLNEALTKLTPMDPVLEELKRMGVELSNAYIFSCDERVRCPLILVSPSMLDRMILASAQRVVELRYTYMVNFSLEALTVLAPESIVEASSEYEELVARALEETLGARLLDVRVAGEGLVRVYVSRPYQLSYRGLAIEALVTYRSHVLASAISAFSGAYVLVSAFIFSLALPAVIASWILARSIGELVAYDVRRFIALGLIRGLPLRSFMWGFLMLSLTVSTIATILSLPLLKALIDATSRLAIGRAYHLPQLTDLGYIVAALVMAFSVSALVYLKVRGILKGYIDLTQASRLYLEGVHEPWRPSTSLTILFLISIFKYLLWITGTRSTELVRMASEVHPLLVVIAVFYVLLDFFIGFIAPVVVPYYLTLTLISREGFIKWVATAASRIAGGSLGDLASSAIPRISPRFGSLTASTTITLSFVIAAAVIRASIEEWYTANSPILANRVDLGSAFFNTMALSMMFYSVIAFTLLSSFILLSSMMVSYTLFKSLERELSILKTRGLPLGGLVRFTYSQTLTLTVIALLLSPLGVISAKGFVETFNAVFSGPLTARGLTAPGLTVDLVGVSVVLLAVVLSLIAPLALLTHMSRRLSLELVSRV